MEMWQLFGILIALLVLGFLLGSYSKDNQKEIRELQRRLIWYQGDYGVFLKALRDTNRGCERLRRKLNYSQAQRVRLQENLKALSKHYNDQTARELDEAAAEELLKSTLNVGLPAMHIQ